MLEKIISILSSSYYSYRWFKEHTAWFECCGCGALTTERIIARDFLDETKKRKMLTDIFGKAPADDLKKFYSQLLLADKSVFPDINIVIITATDTEYETILEMNEFSWRTDIGIPAELMGFGARYDFINGYSILLLKQREMGMVETAVVSEKIIHIIKPQYVFMCGIAASIDKEELRLYDVIVVDECWDYGCGKLEGDGITSETFFTSASHYRENGLVAKVRDKINTIDENLCAALKEYTHKARIAQNPLVKIGKMVSGAAVIKNKVVVDIIKKQSTKVYSLDMESYALYYAFHQYNSSSNKYGKIEYLTVKSISDFADANKSNEYQQNAAYLSAKTILFIIFNCLIGGGDIV